MESITNRSNLKARLFSPKQKRCYKRDVRAFVTSFETSDGIHQSQIAIWSHFRWNLKWLQMEYINHKSLESHSSSLFSETKRCYKRDVHTATHRNTLQPATQYCSICFVTLQKRCSSFCVELWNEFWKCHFRWDTSITNRLKIQDHCVVCIGRVYDSCRH